jgi:hypothetical protein
MSLWTIKSCDGDALTTDNVLPLLVFMAKRRMFSIDVVGQDNFLDMPTDSRELYFQLGMYADDEGFVSPRKVMRITGSGQDALSILHAKGFIYTFSLSEEFVPRQRVVPPPL